MAINTRAFLGVEGLDQILKDGMSFGTQIMVQGDTGVGKTVLAGDFIKEGLQCGDTCIYVACDEPPEAMRQHLMSFKVGTRAYEKAGRLILVDAYEEEQSTEKYRISDLNNLEKFFYLEKQILNEFKGKKIRLIVDSLSTLLTAVPAEDILEFHRSRLKNLRRNNILTMDIFVHGVLDDKIMTISSHLYNIILKMNFGGSPAHPVRMIQIGKVRSQRFVAAQYMFNISPTFGIIVASEMEVGV
ncbi:RAD55 family ATPase [Desulfolucanica intricata]|uniref:RAD55 family ATPase n=1 Tax=Desulfolucanica intricata TaxID=1285191 RepID=UPI0008339458|nr:RAD55 family ATPase [Desulfolucanica intricata]